MRERGGPDQEQDHDNEKNGKGGNVHGFGYICKFEKKKKSQFITC